jgi:hypothetical protein
MFVDLVPLFFWDASSKLPTCVDNLLFIVCIFTRETVLLRLFDPEEEGCRNLQNVVKCMYVIILSFLC